MGEKGSKEKANLGLSGLEGGGGSQGGVWPAVAAEPSGRKDRLLGLLTRDSGHLLPVSL